MNTNYKIKIKRNLNSNGICWYDNLEGSLKWDEDCASVPDMSPFAYLMLLGYNPYNIIKGEPTPLGVTVQVSIYDIGYDKITEVYSLETGKSTNFRGKGLGGKWFYGNFRICNGIAEIIDANGNMHTVKRSSVGMRSRLKDKHNRPIYEGDLVKLENGKICEVQREGEKFKLSDSLHSFDSNLHIFEIIGSISENVQVWE